MTGCLAAKGKQRQLKALRICANLIAGRRRIILSLSDDGRTMKYRC